MTLKAKFTSKKVKILTHFYHTRKKKRRNLALENNNYEIENNQNYDTKSRNYDKKKVQIEVNFFIIIMTLSQF